LAGTVDIIEHTGMSFNDNLDWGQVRADAFALAEGAETTFETYPAIKHAFGALKTGHSVFFTPAQVKGIFNSNTDVDGSKAVSGKRLENDLGYVAVRDIGGNLETLKEYANALAQLIRDIDQQPTCGWIVDLRANTGGSMFPMVAGLTPIIGEGEIGGFLLGDGQRKTLSLQDGRVLVDDVVIPKFGELLDEPLYTLKRPAPPVAVLVGKKTASSAEITALAFIGRPDSRLFGEPTGGYTTANEVFPLFDGAMLVLTFATELDRTGAVYSESIIPDELVSDTKAMDAAIEWLLAQPACVSE
jgi:C-terminal processing protease CtpA/Prc